MKHWPASRRLRCSSRDCSNIADINAESASSATRCGHRQWGDNVEQLNWIAIIVAALGSFLLGGPWYSKAVFGNAWNREAGQSKPAGSGHPAKVFGLSFVFSLIAAAAFAWVLGPNPSLTRALTMGLVIGACFVATSFGINYQFANRSTVLWLIDAGYHIAQFLVFGLVLGLWHR
jgi:hypothetical protein